MTGPLLSRATTFGLFLCAVLAISSPGRAQQNPLNVFESSRAACYRIPAIVGDGKVLLAFAEQRFGYDRDKADRQDKSLGATASAQLPGDCSDSGFINIVMRRSDDGGKNWGKPGIVIDRETLSTPPFDVVLAGNPTPILSDGKVTLLFASTRAINGSNNTKCLSKPEKFPDCTGGAEHGLWKTESVDQGETWTKPVPLALSGDPKKFRRPGPGHGLKLPNGRLVASGYLNLLLSDDDGKTWQLGASSERGELKGTEASIAYLDDQIISFIRPTDPTFKLAREMYPFRLKAKSADGGASYDDFQIDRSLPVPPVQAGSIAIRQRLFVSFPSNATTLGADSNLDRRVMTIAGAVGDKWQSCVIDPAAAGYSDLIRIDDETIGVLYEGDSRVQPARPDTRKTIRFQRFRIDDLGSCPQRR